MQPLVKDHCIYVSAWTLARILPNRGYPAASWAPCGARRTWGAQMSFTAPLPDRRPSLSLPTSRGVTQQALQHGLDGSTGQGLLQRRRQPRLGMLLAMPPNQVALRADLRRTFLGKALLDVGPDQVHGDQVPIHRLERTHAKIGQP